MVSCKILVVEDDRDDALLLRRALEGAARRRAVALAVEHSANGFEGIATVGRSDLIDALPDAVVVDLNMPIMDGMAFLRSLRGALQLDHLHAAVLTTSTERAIHEAASCAGADSVFVKPDTFVEFLTIAEEILTAAGV
jgi:CheY-like chemotaxis protein